MLSSISQVSTAQTGWTEQQTQDTIQVPRPAVFPSACSQNRVMLLSALTQKANHLLHSTGMLLERDIFE